MSDRDKSHVSQLSADRSAGNLFEAQPRQAEPEEIFETLLASPHVRIERIVSTGQASPPGFWYDEPAAEWVMLVQGSAEIRFADEANPRVLRPGDYLYIAPHRRHRVESTLTSPPTLWLAVHITDGS